MTYLNDLPSLTPSKPTTSVSDSESDSIPERFTDDDEERQQQQQQQQEEQPPSPSDLISSINLNPNQNNDHQLVNSHLHRTPSSQTSLSAFSNNHISLSEPVPIRNNKINRKRSLSTLVALRYRGGKADSEIGDEERGLLALDLDTYINSGEPECIPETRALPPSALFPTLSAVLQTNLNENQRKIGVGKKKELRLSNNNKSNKEGQLGTLDNQNDIIDLNSENLLIPTPRSEWPFGGGTGPGKTSRGFIPGRALLDNESTLDPCHCSNPNTPTHPQTISSQDENNLD